MPAPTIIEESPSHSNIFSKFIRTVVNFLTLILSAGQTTVINFSRKVLLEGLNIDISPGSGHG